jgi:hypothetical protein
MTANRHPKPVPTHQAPLSKSTASMDLKKITTKLVSTTMSNEDPQLILLSGVQFELLLSRFIRFFPNAKVSDGSQPPTRPAEAPRGRWWMTLYLSLSESAGSRSVHRLVRRLCSVVP